MDTNLTGHTLAIYMALQLFSDEFIIWIKQKDCQFVIERCGQNADDAFFTAICHDECELKVIEKAWSGEIPF